MWHLYGLKRLRAEVGLMSGARERKRELQQQTELALLQHSH